VRLFLDANVLFSAALSPEGRSRALFGLAEGGACTLLSSAHAVTEAQRNVALKAGSLDPTLAELLDSLELVPEGDLRLLAWARELGLPPNDAPILAAAVAARADALVTGDRRHFGQLYGLTTAGVAILSPAEALARMLDQS
jgi:predicted nucleic acid-binding protein